MRSPNSKLLAPFAGDEICTGASVLAALWALIVPRVSTWPQSVSTLLPSNGA